MKRTSLAILLGLAVWLSAATAAAQSALNAPAPEVSLYETVRLDYGLRLQDEEPEPVFFQVVDFVFTTNGHVFEMNRLERKMSDLGGGIYLTSYTSLGFDLADGTPILSPFGIALGGDVEAGAVNVCFRVGADLVFFQGGKGAVVAYGSLGFGF